MKDLLPRIFSTDKENIFFCVCTDKKDSFRYWILKLWVSLGMDSTETEKELFEFEKNLVGKSCRWKNDFIAKTITEFDKLQPKFLEKKVLWKRNGGCKKNCRNLQLLWEKYLKKSTGI